LSPSPRPSPRGRGKPVEAISDPLSLRERVRVRG